MIQFDFTHIFSRGWFNPSTISTPSQNKLSQVVASQTFLEFSPRKLGEDEPNCCFDTKWVGKFNHQVEAVVFLILERQVAFGLWVLGGRAVPPVVVL